VTIRSIQTVVARRYGVTVTDITSKRQGAVVRPRHVAMWIARQVTGHSLPEIGRAFGNRDHTSILHALRRIEALLATEAAAGIWALLSEVDRGKAGEVRQARMRIAA